MTRAHVRLLGPCFKTGRIGCRPIRHRPCVPREASTPLSSRSRRALRAVLTSRTGRQGAQVRAERLARRVTAPQSGSGPTSREAIPLRACAPSYHPRGLLTAAELVVAVDAPESARTDAGQRARRSEDPHIARSQRAES